ncbi:hypothetical protein HNQ07_004291 [Deinococcus metalli]|uniref:Uncharacterized protein n=1 Tax=Deinococcus metalli TaxID=1141878 RepID=A0A7W8NQ86_9DEIO|nr:hypothetical protein [Deinococcus metalli]MBB5378784.1 hypothetical protein [Deinococcus metalli]GHF60755.1 hypothetical protein GCM10017781_41260 [Deinococcus metalli]
MTLIFDHSSQGTTGLKFRKPTEGPEYEMVRNFIEHSLPKPNRNQDLIVLVEPRFNAGAPDVVAVYWNRSKLGDFSHRRSVLSKKDIKIMQYIMQSSGADLEDIVSTFSHDCKKSIDKLISEKMIYHKGRKLFAYSKMKKGVIDRILTIEAKIHDWRGGIIQASNYFWLGEEVYLLIRENNNKDKIIDQARILGVGVIFNGEQMKHVGTHDLVPTYGYWMMNEMILFSNGKVNA